jgi:hypothetical protein
MTRRWIVGMILAGALAAPPAGAISIALLPALADVAVGDGLDIDVVVSGLGAGAPPSLGSYDLDVSFDASRLTFDSLSFGTLLGGPVDSLQSAVAGAGLVDFAELSLLLPAELDALQPASFSIATLHFTVSAEGTSTVAVSQALAGDGEGRPLPIDALASAAITGSAASAVPEPGAAALFALGLLLAVKRGSGIRL